MEVLIVAIVILLVIAFISTIAISRHEMRQYIVTTITEKNQLSVGDLEQLLAVYEHGNLPYFFPTEYKLLKAKIQLKRHETK